MPEHKVIAFLAVEAIGITCSVSFDKIGLDPNRLRFLGVTKDIVLERR